MLRQSKKLLPLVWGLPSLSVRFQSSGEIIKLEEHLPSCPIGQWKVDSPPQPVKRIVLPDWEVKGEYLAYPGVSEKTWKPAPLAPLGGLTPMPDGEELGDMSGYDKRWKLKDDPINNGRMYDSYVDSNPPIQEAIMWLTGFSMIWCIFCHNWHYNL
eukprot:TRINITY_DN11789_c0_g1_i1.p1 TRINITY_DN11789_c0_g1~~TRINITY_DN11789_c0_g1_i1.p1  ORF type:complete len:156 (+),score=20.74 TRINITY_DN11789_c0_g1_i1:73-540(+)